MSEQTNKPNRINDPNSFYDLSAERQGLLISWIHKNFTLIKGVNLKHSSYWLKHQVIFSSEQDSYFTNGEFKGAMLECGYTPNNFDKDNWYFNVSERSIKDVIKNNGSILAKVNISCSS